MINNIFSKEKIKKNDEIKYPIEIDYREKNSLVPAVLTKNFNIEYKELKVADYIVKDVAIERKSVPDLIHSLFDKRIFRQLKEIKQYENYLLIIEGDLRSQTNKLFATPLKKNSKFYRGQKKSLHPDALKGLILSILIKYKVPIIFTRDYSETAEYMLLIAKKQSSNTSINAKKILRSKNEELLFVVESLSGIGPKKTRLLLEKFSTLKNLFAASESELIEILGSHGEKIYRIINLNYIP